MMLPLLVATLVQTIWIVDAANGPGTNFTHLPAAVAVAQSGDTIVVRPGNYAPFDVTGKALTILGAGASSTILNLPTGNPSYQQARISGVPAGATFYVSGIGFAPPPPGPPPLPSNGAMQIIGTTTKVVLSDCVLQAGSGYSGSSGPPGLFVTEGAEAHASRCVFTGANGSGSYLGGGGGPGVWVNGNFPCVFLADACTFTGGARVGGAGGGSGGAGLRVSGGTATLSRCSAYGGGDVTGGYGGPGILVEAGYPSLPGFVRAAGTAADVFQGGPTTALVPNNPAVRATTGGSAIVHGSLTLLPGSPGGPVTQGTVTTLGSVPLPYLSMTGTLTPAGDLVANQPVTATFEGFVPSAPAVLFVDLAPIYLAPGSPIVGAQLVPFPGAAMLDLTLDAAGMFQMSFVPLIDVPALVGVPFFAQFGVLAASGSVRLSNGLIRVVRS